MNDRVEALRAKMESADADSFICYSYPNYRYLSGFTGSLAVLLISGSRAIIMSDFRYRTQIADEVGDFEFVEIKGPPEKTVFEQLGALELSRLAFESAHMTYRQYAQLKTVEFLEFVPTENWIEDLRAVKDDSRMLLR